MNEMPIRLGELIDLLEKEPQGNTVCFDFGGCVTRKIDSYRGYYEDLAIGWDKDAEPVKVSELLAALRFAVGKTYLGYKGGECTMSRATRVWVAN